MHALLSTAISRTFQWTVFYSRVVSLHGFRLLVFLAELNAIESWATDISSAYLQAKTKEKVCIYAGPEFGPLQGHLLIIHLRLFYGLWSSGLRWDEKFSDCPHMTLASYPARQSLTSGCIPMETCYECIAVYVDDIAMALHDPQAFITLLEDKHNFSFKGTGKLSFHLGSDFFHDKHGTLCMAPKKFIEKMVSNYERIFGECPSHLYRSPLEKGDHPELDTSQLLDQKGIMQCQSLIGSLQWAVTIGRFDIATTVMLLSSFRAAPRRGHLDRARRVCGYRWHMKNAIICFRTQEPNYLDLPIAVHDWDTSVYGKISEILPTDAPAPHGKPVVTSYFVDANLYHDMLTGRSVTGVLHLVNQTPIDYFSKKQATVETATYGSEFLAARTCVEQIIDLHNALCYLGVPVHKKSHMFGDNQSVVDSSTRLHAKLHKRHTALSFHHVQRSNCI